MQPASLNPDPATLPLREIHLPESIGWWPPAPGWWILPGLVLLGAAVTWYCRLLYKRHKYSAINMARKELVGIRSRYAADRDARHCVRSVSGLLRRLCISIFPRAETAGLTGAEWLAFLQGGAKPDGTGQQPGGGGRNNGDERLQDMGKLLLEAPYRQQVTEEEVESLIGFCSDWIEGASPDKKSGLSGRNP